MASMIVSFMRRYFFLLTLIFATVGSSTGHAIFAWHETKQVPIERLFTNLQHRLALNTNDLNVAYRLARLHSMAFSTNLTKVNVTKNDEDPAFYSPGDPGVPRAVYLSKLPHERLAALRHLTNAILLYERAINRLKKSTNAVQQQWLILPLELGLAWCLDQAGRRDEALAAYRKTLRIAWKREVTGGFELKQWITGVWNDVRSRRNPIHSRRRGYIGPGVCFSQEVIGYLLNLLDPRKDAKEIAQLELDQQTLQSMGRAVTPILIPLQPDLPLTELVDSNVHVRFDLDGSGLPRQWGWITPTAAWLVWDSDGSGRITSALQMFGAVTFWIFWRDGYDALSSLDADGDGILSGPELHGMALWHDRNSNGVSDPGEVQPVKSYGIKAIACTGRVHSSGILWNANGVTFSNGTSRASYDWISPGAPVELTGDGSRRRGHKTNRQRESSALH